MRFLRFIISKVFIKNLALAILIIVISLLSVFLYLRVYTRHGQSLSVPNFRGLGPEEVARMAEVRNLRFEITDSVYSDEYPRGTVVEQNPKPEFKVKENRTIFLTMNAVTPEMVRMPDVMNVSLRQATAILETAGLEVGKLTYVPDIAVNNVLKQKFEGDEIEPGTRIPKGSVIDLALGRGLSEATTLAPDLIGLDLQEAKNLITSRFLNLGAIIYDQSFENKEDSSGAFIWKQKPEYDDKSFLNLGSTMDIWVTVDSTKLPQPDTLSTIPEDEQNYIPDI